MSRKFTPIVFMIGAVMLLASRVDANPLFRFFEPVAPPVPEIDFRDLGSVGIGTAIVAASYVVQKAYHKVVGRKQK